MVTTLLESAMQHLGNIKALRLTPWGIRKNVTELSAALNDLVMLVRYLNEPVAMYSVPSKSVQTLDVDSLVAAAAKRAGEKTGSTTVKTGTGAYL